MTTDEKITILKDAILGLVEVCRVMNEQGAKQDKRIADLAVNHKGEYYD